jgi:hypothetical protein
VKQLLEQARKRVIGHLVLDKGALALTIGMGGAVLLLLIGTQILDWYWPVLLAAVSLGVGVYQLRKFIPSGYVLAQRIDRKMNLADSLSTAVYFSENPKPGLESVCAVQFQAADRLASGVNLESALPLTRSRYVVPAAVLFVAASGLFFTRYLMTGSMDLRASLIDMVVDNFFTSPAEELVAKAQKAANKQRPFDPTQPTAPPDEQTKMDLPPDAQKGNELKSSDPSDANSGDEGQKGADEQQSDQEQSDSSKDGSPQDKQSDKQGREGDDKGQSESQSQQPRSMMDKLQDAFNNLMNKMKSEPQKGGPKGGEKQQAKQNKGDQSKEKGEKSEGDPQSDSDQQGDQGDPKDAKQSNAPGQKTSEEAKSGAGQDDGKKDILNAKELEAMGKMSELLAERSAAISGDMLVEVGSTSQQLKTAMTQQKAGHSDAGGEIHRDQVPLAYQTFVDRYFQEVRKAPAAKAKAQPAVPKQ